MNGHAEIRIVGTEPVRITLVDLAELEKNERAFREDLHRREFKAFVNRLHDEVGKSLSVPGEWFIAPPAINSRLRNGHIRF